MKKYSLCAIAALTLSLSACASMMTGSYQQPPANAPFATLKGSLVHKSLMGAFHNARVDQIDNQSVVGLVSGGYETFRLAPGAHVITVECVFGGGIFSGDPRHGYTDVSFTAKAGQHYQVQSKVVGSRVQAWVTQANGAAVSSIASTSYQDLPTQAAPIIITNH